ncbi:MAG: hypothetical protein A3E87_00060 [Gammaproteobacteria bacterium RIFCSPHIGHO2_12_FULL_35_23]|nr:MAG: hypothetical protein A3E87_00060 [Gammaproteobacteria bacterium RIFCSPHIGHO2_12_FULL_35_23]
MNILFKTLKEKIRANPSGLYVLFYTEMWELFGRFGITALLVLYLTNVFHVDDAKAFSIYSAFIALTFATPILGGYFSDKYLGTKRAILLGAFIMILGDALMVIPVEWIVFLGLAIVAVGSGFFLPSIPPLVSALYERDERKRDAGFTLYYLGKNLGALIAPILCGFVGQWFGINYAFILSTVGMISGVIIFLLGQKHLSFYHQQAKSAKKKFYGLSTNTLIYLIAVIMVPVVMLVLATNIDGYLLAVTGVICAVILTAILTKRSMVERKHTIALLIAIACMIIFEAFLGQGGTTLNLFIERNINRQFLGVIFPPGFFYALDPVFMLLMGPFLAGFWMRLADRGKEPAVTTKFALALFLLALGFLVFVLAAHQATLTGSASLIYIVVAYFLFPMAELCIIPISLSLVTKMSPVGLNALMVGIWMLSNAASSYFTGEISKIGQVNFPLNTTASLQQAAAIYQHLFADTAKILAVTGILILLIGPIVKRLIKAKAIN